jgi:protein-S-isoprenylcysteine O-methyltransferase Ste14
MSERTHALDHRVPPPLLVGVVGAAMLGATRRDLALGLPLAIGALVALLGFGLVVWGFRTFRAAGTTIDPLTIDGATSVVSTGPFARSRNPMYVGFTLMLVGWAFALANPFTLVGPVVFVLWLGRFQVRPEERAMQRRFGPAWEAYAARVPRWL